MCFSAEASFSAAALLAVVGFSTVADTKNKRELCLAAIPLIFALQQFSEGFLWVAMGYDMADSLLATIAKYAFLLIAYVNWPIWLPLSLYLTETHKIRRNIIGACFIVGLIFVIWNLTMVLGEPIAVGIVDHSIQYSAYDPGTHAEFVFMRLLYVIAVLVPAFASSYRYMWVFGLVVGATFLAADYFYHNTFTSVWCFFAAVTSGALYLVLRANRRAAA